MEQIKIRGWNTQENKMLYRNLFDMNWYTTEKNDENGSHCWGAISGGQSRFIKPMLWTGLKDKNGKEIYSGDILQFNKEYTTEHKLKPLLQEVGWLNQGWVPYSMEDGEIVGNIYEHPHLLNSKE